MSDVAATVLIMFYEEESPEPAPKYDDMPPWHPDDNFDNVKRRALNASWDMLMRHELKDISFRELAKVANVTPAAIYHYFKNLDALAAQLAVLSALKLKRECNDALRGSKMVSRYIRALLLFAQKRPNHFALIVSKGGRNLGQVWSDLNAQLEIALHRLLHREPTDEERISMRIQLFGGAAMVASGLATVSQVLTMLVATLRAWRRTSRVRRAA